MVGGGVEAAQGSAVATGLSPFILETLGSRGAGVNGEARYCTFGGPVLGLGRPSKGPKIRKNSPKFGCVIKLTIKKCLDRLHVVGKNLLRIGGVA